VNAWTFPAVPYVLTYSSGYDQNGQIDRIEIRDGGFTDVGGGDVFEHDDDITIYDGSNDIFQALNGWIYDPWLSGSIPSNLVTATEGIDRASLCYRTHYWGSWSTWGTYEYDYITTDPKYAIVTRTVG
jgi:hypothetical protein